MTTNRRSDRRRFSFDQLERELLCRGIEPEWFIVPNDQGRGGTEVQQRHRTHLYPTHQLATILHTPRYNILRWRADGVTHRTADRLAVHLNSHPVLIWPDYYDEVLAYA